MLEALGYEFMQHAMIAGLLAAITCGVIGSYVVVKRIVFISGGISHSAYGGVGLGYLIGVSPMWAAMGFSLIAGLGIGLTTLKLRQASDTVIGVIWASGMALGILFVSVSPGAAPNLMTYLFGNVLMVSLSDLYLMGGLAVTIIIVVSLLYKELLTVSFDEEYAAVLGLPVSVIYLLLLSLVAMTVIILMRVVGIIMVIALLTIPAATARLYVDRMSRLMVVASIIGAVCTTFGLVLSFTLNEVYDKPFPSGPVIILLAAFVYAAALGVRKLVR